MLQPLYRALVNSLNGLRYGMAAERAIRQESLILIVSVPSSLIVATDTLHMIVLIGVVLAVLCIELLNTAIERLCDIVQPNHDLRIKSIKDMASAACFCMQVIAGLIWALAVWARVWPHWP